MSELNECELELYNLFDGSMAYLDHFEYVETWHFTMGEKRITEGSS